MECSIGSLKNINFILTVICWVLNCVCLGFLTQYNFYSVPRWLWIMNNINSLTYTIILTEMTISHVVKKNNDQLLDFLFTIIGVPMFFTGAIGGFVHEYIYEPEDAENGPNQKYFECLMTAISLIMLVQIGITIYKQRRSTRAMENQQ